MEYLKQKSFRMGKLFVILCAVLIAGCATTNKVPLLPFIQGPAIKIPAKPAYPIANLNKNSPPSEVMKAYVASVYLADQQIHILNEIINKYVNSPGR